MLVSVLDIGVCLCKSNIVPGTGTGVQSLTVTYEAIKLMTNNYRQWTGRWEIEKIVSKQGRVTWFYTQILSGSESDLAVLNKGIKGLFCSTYRGI